MTSSEPKSEPEIGSTGSGDEFYEWCARGELRLRRCNACGEWCHVPREICPSCTARDWSWEPVRGTGRVFTWTVVHRAMHPDFVDDVPYAVVVVELEEGPRITSRLVDCPPEEIVMEMPVEVVFERNTGSNAEENAEANTGSAKRVLPKFRRRTPSAKESTR
jgi:uncharacterized OB-fold protein